MKAVKNNVYSINSSSLLKRKSKEKYKKILLADDDPGDAEIFKHAVVFFK